MNAYGWDTVYVITTELANQQLHANATSLISTFIFTETDPIYDITTELNGSFGAWQIVEGGSGKLIHMQIPIDSGAMIFDGEVPSVIGPSNTPIDIATVTVVVEISLNLLPSEVNPEQQDLKFYFNANGDEEAPQTPGLVSVIQVDDPNNKLPTDTAASILGNAIAACLVANADEVSYVFAGINITPTGDSAWLTPVASDYCYQSTQSNPLGYLGILSVVTDRDISSLQRSIDPSFLNDSDTLFFGIDQWLFLKYMIMPVLPSVFGHGTSAATFRYDSNQNAIVNTASFATDSVKYGLITYHPQIDQLNITVQDNALMTSTKGSCSMGIGISMTFEVDSKNVSTYAASSNTLRFQSDSNPTKSHNADIPWYDKLLGPVVDLVMALVVDIIADGVADGLNANLPSLSAAAPTAITWNGVDAFNVRYAALSSDFYMQGSG